MEQKFDCYAHSFDGREFIFESPTDKPFSEGEFVILETNKNFFLGQIYEKEFSVDRQLVQNGSYQRPFSSETRPVYKSARISGIRGSGKLLGKIRDGKIVNTSFVDQFHNASIDKAEKSIIEIYFNSCIEEGNNISIGNFSDYKNLDVMISLDGLDRHTFLTGQTGSGKSNSIKVVLFNILGSKNMDQKLLYLI